MRVKISQHVTVSNNSNRQCDKVIVSEAATRIVLYKKVLLEISQIHRKTPVSGPLFLMKCRPSGLLFLQNSLPLWENIQIESPQTAFLLKELTRIEDSPLNN